MKNKNWTLITLFGVFALAMFLPIEAFAQTDTTAFGAAEMNTNTNSVMNFLFTTGLRIAAVMAGGWGVLQAFIHGSFKPIAIYGGIGLSTIFLPSFINGVFNVSSMLLP